MPNKILLADDSVTIQKVVELTFSEGDFAVTCVSNGKQAIQKIQELRPDILLCDVIMPEVNGYDVTLFVKRNLDYAGIPVILLTGTFEPFDEEKARQCGADTFVTKPFDSRMLVEKVEELLKKRVVLDTSVPVDAVQIFQERQEFTLPASAPGEEDLLAAGKPPEVAALEESPFLEAETFEAIATPAVGFFAPAPVPVAPVPVAPAPVVAAPQPPPAAPADARPLHELFAQPGGGEFFQSVPAPEEAGLAPLDAEAFDQFISPFETQEAEEVVTEGLAGSEPLPGSPFGTPEEPAAVAPPIPSWEETPAGTGLEAASEPFLREPEFEPVAFEPAPELPALVPDEGPAPEIVHDMMDQEQMIAEALSVAPPPAEPEPQPEPEELPQESESEVPAIEAAEPIEEPLLPQASEAGAEVPEAEAAAPIEAPFLPQGPEAGAEVPEAEAAAPIEGFFLPQGSDAEESPFLEGEEEWSPAEASIPAPPDIVEPEAEESPAPAPVEAMLPDSEQDVELALDSLPAETHHLEAQLPDIEEEATGLAPVAAEGLEGAFSVTEELPPPAEEAHASSAVAFEAPEAAPEEPSEGSADEAPEEAVPEAPVEAGYLDSEPDLEEPILEPIVATGLEEEEVAKGPALEEAAETAEEYPAEPPAEAGSGSEEVVSDLASSLLTEAPPMEEASEETLEGAGFAGEPIQEMPATETEPDRETITEAEEESLTTPAEEESLPPAAEEESLSTPEEEAWMAAEESPALAPEGEIEEPPPEIPMGAVPAQPATMAFGVAADIAPPGSAPSLPETEAFQAPAEEEEPGEPVAETPAAEISPTVPRYSAEDLEAAVRKVVGELAPDIIRQVAWEVIPELAESLIKRRIRELESAES